MGMIYKLILIGLHVLGFGISLADHGKPKKGTHNVWYSIISSALVMFLLYKSGFFNDFKL